MNLMEVEKAYRRVPVTIIGAGPIGLEMAASLKRANIEYLHFDAKQIGYTISWWPRNTEFFSTTERIEIAGIPIQNTNQGRTSGEEYLAYLRSVVEQLDLKVNTYEPVIKIERDQVGFLIHTRSQTGEHQYLSDKVVIAIGDMHAPNILGIPGENLPHVSHYFTGPHMYFRKRLLVVGGRNSAVEAALRCWRSGCDVSISYRRDAFDAEIVKNHLLPALHTQIEFGNITFYPSTVPIEITPEYVVLEKVSSAKFEKITVRTDFVLLNTGLVQDPSLFRSVGVKLTGERLVPNYDPETMETNMPGIFVAGTAAAGTQKRYKLFIENCHVHVAKIMKATTGQAPEQLGTVPERQYEPTFETFQAN